MTNMRRHPALVRSEKYHLPPWLLAPDLRNQTLGRRMKYVSEWYVPEVSSPFHDHCLRQIINMTQLKEVEIKIITDQNKYSKAFEKTGRDEDIFAYLDLVFGQDRCDVQFQGLNIATTQTKTQHALQQLIYCSKERVRYKALVARAEFKEKLDAALQPLSVDKSKLRWSMNIQIFGVRSIADIVAKELSKYRLFLQHPYPMPFNAAYENPQYFSMVGSSFTNGAVLPPISVEATQREIESNAVSEELNHGLDDLRAVINNLPKHECLKEVDVDERINTDLLRQVYRIKDDFGERLIIH
jgi:SWI/SNF-related matrix-associated actin-dependent regulator of chromatin subfamily A3